MGVFDLGDMFDFDGDGKTDASEEFMAYMMMEELEKEDEESSDDYLEDSLDDLPLSYSAFRPSACTTQTNSGRSGQVPAQVVEENLAQEHREKSEPTATLTKEEYYRLRRNLLSSLRFDWVIVLVVVFLALLAIWWGFRSGQFKDSPGLAVFFLIGAPFAVYMLLRDVFRQIGKQAEELSDLRERWEQSLSQEEKDALLSTKRKRNWIILGCFSVSLLAVIVIASINSSKTAGIYREAEALIVAGEYDDAKAVLESIQEKHYRDTDALIALCTAHHQYDSGRGVDAFYTLKDVRFSYVSQEQRSEIAAFKEILKAEYDAYIKQQADRAQAEYERRQSLPFPSVGQYVTKSQLDGMSWDGKDNKTFDVSTTKYIYVGGGGEKYRLWITDYNCIKKVVKLSSGSSGNTSGRSGTSSFDTGPSVDGYSDPEEFYYWNWDDFVDFEDAEAYYYAHGGK